MNDNSKQNDDTRTHVVLTKGTMVSHYRIVEKIGAGGMGEVYLAEDTKLHRPVALKFLPQHLVADPDAKTRFTREAESAAQLNHPNIVTIYEVGEYHSRPFFAMEHVTGHPLHFFAHQQPQPLDRIIELAIQLCEGLDKAHQAGITHRDIKPANIVIDADGRPKILDFGLASVRGEEKLTKTGSTIGTVAYMSPEQVRGKAVDRRSDLFSLGIVLYELITSRTPYRRESEAATLQAIVSDPPEPLSRYKAGVPDGLQRIVAKLLEKDPALRYQSAMGVVSDLKRLPGGTTPTVDRPPVDWWNRYVVPSAVLVLLVMLGYWYWVFQRESETGAVKSLVVLPFENLGAAEDEYFADGMTDEITARLAGIGSLRVISRTSAVYYKNSNKPLKQIGKELDVDYVLEGTIRWDKSTEPSRVRIIPQLIQVTDDFHIWAETFERELTQVFAVQEEIATLIADALDVTLLDSEKQLLAVPPTENLLAYDFYLRGKEYFERGGKHERGVLAIRMWEQATELDSTFALAFAWLARARAFVYFDYPEEGTENLRLAKNAAEMALRLSDGGPEGHMAMGYYYYYGSRDYDRALEHLSEALNDKPNNCDLLAAVAYIQRRQGKWEEALVNLQRSSELDPRSVTKIAELATTSFLMRRYDDAERYFDRGYIISPDAVGLYITEFFRRIAADGDIQDARDILEEGVKNVGPRYYAGYFELIDIWARDFESALRRRSSLDVASLGVRDYYIMKGAIYRLMNEEANSLLYYDSARVRFEERIKQAPGYPPNHADLSLAYAGLGRKEDALREGETAIRMLPVSKDAVFGPLLIYNLILTYTVIGKYDRAIDQIDYLLSIPCPFSIHFFELDPILDSLRDHPRFQALLEKYEQQKGN